MTMWEPLAIAFVVAIVLTPIVIWIGHRHSVLDHPNERSSHQSPTPRGGGIAILIGAVVPVAMAVGSSDQVILRILTCAAVVALLGLFDDVVSLRAGVKLLVQVVAAVACLTLVDLTLRLVEIPSVGSVRFPFAVGVGLSIFWIVGVTNAYNFMDGVNGIASIEAIICALAYAVMFRFQSDTSAALLCLGIAGASAGFLLFNSRGKVFMGDVGSATLGFIFAALALRLAAEGASFVAACLPLLPFLLDTGMTLLRRVRRRERLFDAHRTHAYQRLTDLGLPHMAVSLIYGLFAATGAILTIFWAALLPVAAALAAFVLVAVFVTAAIVVEKRVVESGA